MLARQVAPAVGVGTCWPWETAATLPFTRWRKALQRPRGRRGCGISWRPPAYSLLSQSWKSGCTVFNSKRCRRSIELDYSDSLGLAWTFNILFIISGRVTNANNVWTTRHRHGNYEWLGESFKFVNFYTLTTANILDSFVVEHDIGRRTRKHRTRGTDTGEIYTIYY